MQAIIKPLLKQGQSPYVIFEQHKDELPVGVRSFYSYFSKGLLDLTSLELPRKARWKNRNNNKKKNSYRKDKIDRSEREYKDVERHFILPIFQQII